MPSTGHFVEFDRYQMAGRSEKMPRRIDAKLRIHTFTELSVLLSAEVVEICSHSFALEHSEVSEVAQQILRTFGVF